MDTKPIDPQAPQAFRTNNLPLAIALHAAGVPFANEDGKTIAGLNQYSLGFIRAQIDPRTGRPRCQGMTVDDAIKKLWSLGIPGNVEYCFLRSETLTAVAKGWDEQGESEEVETPLQCSEEEFGRIARALARSRAEFVGAKDKLPLWRRKDASGNLFVPAIKHTEGTTHTERHGQRVTTVTRDAKLEGVSV